MKRWTIPAGSTPGEKERGHWIKLTDAELDLALHLASVCAPPSTVYTTNADKTLLAKLTRLKEAA